MADEVKVEVVDKIVYKVEVVDKIVDEVEAEDEAETMEAIQRFLELSSPILVRNSGF